MSIAAISAFTYFQTFNTFVLAMWTNSVASRESSTEHKSEVANEEYNSSQSFYLGLYCVAVAVSIIFMFLGGSLMAKLRVKVAKRIHGDMLKSILRAPIDFFDITPAGRIMNRFSKEQNSVDEFDNNDCLEFCDHQFCYCSIFGYYHFYAWVRFDSFNSTDFAVLQGSIVYSTHVNRSAAVRSNC